MLRLTALALLAAPAVATAAPVTLRYTGRVLDAAGGGLNGTHNVRVTLYRNATGTGTHAVYWRRTDAVDLQDGYFSVSLDTDDTARNVDSQWFTGDVWVGVKVDTDPELSPREALVSVPKAAQAEVASSVPVITGALSASCTDGQLAVEASTNDLRYCSGGVWRTTNQVRVESVDSARQWSNGTIATSCDGYRHPTDTVNYAYSGEVGDGIYRIQPAGVVAPYTVYCDQTTDNGGWTLLGTVYGADSNNWGTSAGYWSDANTLGSVNSPFTDFKSEAWLNLDVTNAEVLWQRRYSGTLKGVARLSNNCLKSRTHFVDLFATVDYSLCCGTGQITVVQAASDSAGVAAGYEEGGASGIGGSSTNGFCWMGGDNNSNLNRGHAGWNQSTYSTCVAAGHLGYIALWSGGTQATARQDIAVTNMFSGVTSRGNNAISFFAR